MSENNALHSLKIKINELVVSLKNNLLIVSAGAGLLIILGCGFYGYRYWEIQKEEAAHTILFDCLAQADEAAQGKAQWADVAAMCHAGYQKFSATKVAPYILAIYADALLADNRQQEALEQLDIMLSKIGSESPLYALYRVKQSLLKLDMPDAALQETGLRDLEQLAADGSNIYNDEAQFYLGLYYHSKNEDQKALEVWKKLATVNENLSDANAHSPWAAMAQEKINGLA